MNNKKTTGSGLIVNFMWTVSVLLAAIAGYIYGSHQAITSARDAMVKQGYAVWVTGGDKKPDLHWLVIPVKPEYRAREDKK